MRDFLLNKLDSVNAWIGAIGFVLVLLKFNTMLFIFFSLLILLPDTKFTDLFKLVSDEIRKKAGIDLD
jgi:hypothetical protein